MNGPSSRRPRRGRCWPCRRARSPERAPLGQVEAEIEGGWVAAASGYREIRNGRLYLQASERYDDFEHYCRARWGLGRNMVDKMIQALEVVDALRKNITQIPPPENDSQARALLPLVDDPSAMAEVLLEARRQAALRGTGVTAHRLAAGVRRRLGASPGHTPAGYPAGAQVGSGQPGFAPEGGAEAGGPGEGDAPPDGSWAQTAGDTTHAAEDEGFEGTKRFLDETVAGFARLSQALSAHVASVDLTVAELRRLARLIGKARAIAQSGERLAARPVRRRTRRGGEPLPRLAFQSGAGAPNPRGIPARVLAALRARGPSTSRELAEATGLELHVVSGRLSGLRARGLLHPAQARRQRPDGRWDDVYEALGGP